MNAPLAARPHVVVVVGNPRAASRTRDAGERVARSLTDGEVTTIELAELNAALFDREDETVVRALARVREADLVVFASPTYKATYTGLLKLFLDLIPGTSGLAGVVAVPLMLGGSPEHSLAPELTLRPVLAELGATIPAPGLFLTESTYADDGGIEEYARRWAGVVQRLLPDGATTES
jgi:FMN reductase